MQNITEVVDLLENKFKLLVEKFDFLEEENSVLRNNLTALQQQIMIKTQLLADNSTELHALRVAKTIQGSSDNTKETTQKINALIKEVDLCIAQLSD